MKHSSCLVAFVLIALANAQAPNDAKLKLQKAEKAYASTKGSWTKDKSNQAKKRAYVNATVQLGTVVMTSPLLGAKVKYPRALRLYREALKLDPNNKEAKANKKMIEDIYRSMGRPIPH